MNADVRQMLPAVCWARSSRCIPNANCVEVNRAVAGLIGVRDTKGPATAVLVFGSRQWSTFVSCH